MNSNLSIWLKNIFQLKTEVINDLPIINDFFVGKGGDSYWGGPFKDEFKQFLSHTGRGILSMANSGPDTNKSQFFITYRSCKHLDSKHTVFGRIVGGLDTLANLERIETDNKDVPIEEIIVQRWVFSLCYHRCP